MARPTSTSAEKVRRHRARRRRGIAVLRVEVPFIPVTEWLVEAGYLAPNQAEDRAAAGRALAALLKDKAADV